MFCAECGNKLPEGAAVCPVCGTPSDNEPETAAAQQTGAKNFQGTMQPNMGGATGAGQQTQNYYTQEQQERNIKNVEELFVDSNEKQVAVLGSGYLKSMLYGGGLSKGFGILTDKRYYFKGKCYSRRGKHFVKTDEEWTVDVKDITASGFIYNRKISWLIAAVFCILTGLLLSLMFGDDGICLIIGAVAGLVFLVVYALSKRGMYLVTFAGGSVALRISKYGGTKEVKKFDKQLRRTKDNAIK